jgi:beta-carotene hydroxylase
MSELALRRPGIAWPTLVLAAVALGGWGGAMVLARDHLLLGALLACLCGFLAFTPVHEAAHFNVARARWLNDLVGHLCAIPLLGVLGPYRYLHGEHHLHTNAPAQDPDAWCGRGPPLLVPLRWATHDLALLVFYLRRFLQRPLAERMEILVVAAIYGAAIALGVASHHGTWLLAIWILPARLVLAVLAWTFAWLPHRAHHITAAADRYRATTLHSGRLWAVLSIGQSFHLLHHLFPGVPFYRYREVWDARRSELVAHGAVDRALHGDQPSRAFH